MMLVEEHTFTRPLRRVASALDRVARFFQSLAGMSEPQQELHRLFGELPPKLSFHGERGVSDACASRGLAPGLENKEAVRPTKAGKLDV